MKKSLLYFLLVLVIAGGAIGYWLYARRIPDALSRRPDLMLSADELTRSFELDPVTADKQLNGKVLRVTGRIKSIGSQAAVVLETMAGPSEVVVGLDERHKADVNKIKVGTTGVFQGMYSGFEKSSGNPDDLLSTLGTTVQLRSAALVQPE